MQFLDAIGLAYFWEKIKNWVNINYLSLIGGTIRGNVTFLHQGDGGTSIVVSPSSITKSGYDNHYLFASGKMIPIGEANGVAGLDANGNVPLSQLGNLDTTVAEVVTALPTTNIKKHIYLIEDEDGDTQNQYKEYIYTGDTSATYDASKWEKLGDFRATVDLAEYAKKSDTVKSIAFSSYGSTPVKILKVTKADGTEETISIPKASSGDDGFMGSDDKRKLDGIANNANNYSLPTASSTTKGGITLGYSQNDKNYPVALDNSGKAYVNVPWTDTNTTYGLATPTNDGLMSKADKVKIDGIDTTYAKKIKLLESVTVNPTEQSNEEIIELEFEDQEGNPICYANLPVATIGNCGLIHSHDKAKLDGIDERATADSAITTAEIDALFA